MTSPRTERIRANGAQLHVELRGDGPPTLLIPGAAGDGGQYDVLADRLAASATVVTYDRRSNSRSSRADDWATTSVDQHADDAAALISELDLGPAHVFGNSTGALVALDVALRAPEQARTAVLHEPTLMAVLADPDDAMASVQPVIAGGMANGGPRGGAEAFLAFAAGPAWQTVPAEVRERMLDNAEVLFQAEFGSFMSWRPDEQALKECAVPIAVLSAAQTAPFFAEAAQWVAGHAGTTAQTVPGGHMGFLEDPAGFASALRQAQNSIML